MGGGQGRSPVKRIVQIQIQTQTQIQVQTQVRKLMLWVQVQLSEEDAHRWGASGLRNPKPQTLLMPAPLQTHFEMRRHTRPHPTASSLLSSLRRPA